MSEIIKKLKISGKYGPHYITSLTQKSQIMGQEHGFPYGCTVLCYIGNFH